MSLYLIQASVTASTLNLASLSLTPPGTETLAYFSQRCFSMLALLGSLLHHKCNTLSVHRVLVNVILSLILGSQMFKDLAEVTEVVKTGLTSFLCSSSEFELSLSLDNSYFFNIIKCLWKQNNKLYF